jgi:hypothetical protein
MKDSIPMESVSIIFTNGTARRMTNEKMAERVGFEPTVEFPQHTLSKRAP